jgi:hypothetical protein
MYCCWFAGCHVHGSRFERITSGGPAASVLCSDEVRSLLMFQFGCVHEQEVTNSRLCMTLGWGYSHTLAHTRYIIPCSTPRCRTVLLVRLHPHPLAHQAVSECWGWARPCCLGSLCASACALRLLHPRQQTAATPAVLGAHAADRLHVRQRAAGRVRN